MNIGAKVAFLQHGGVINFGFITHKKTVEDSKGEKVSFTVQYLNEAGSAQTIEDMPAENMDDLTYGATIGRTLIENSESYCWATAEKEKLTKADPIPF